METIAVFFLATAAMGGVVWVFLYPILSGERKAEQRMANVAKAEPVARVTRGQQKSRRDIIEATLKEFDERHKHNARPPLAVRIARAGLSWSKQQFLMISAGIGAVMFMGGLFVDGGIYLAATLGFVGGLGLPRWLLSFLRKTPREQVPRRLPGRGRHHRARRQGRPAAARLPEDDHGRGARAGEIGIPRHHRDPGDRHAARRSLRQALRTHAGAGSELLRHRHRDPAEVRRQSCRKRSAIFRACCATARR